MNKNMGVRVPWLALIAGVAVIVAAPERARAYAWMIGHGYTSCATCHADPSGGGLLTEYGRAQGVLLLSDNWGREDDEAAVARGNFLFGAIKVPDGWLFGGALRAATLVSHANGSPVDARFILMQSDLSAQTQLGRVRANASLGFAADGAFAATVVGSDEGRLVSRTHWVGIDLGEDRNVLLRAGRFALPYGVRMISHTAWVRASTRTDINVAQQHGVALAYTGDHVRAEIMAILGNYQINPDEYRERGYSGYFEWAPGERFALGVSSLVTHAERDLVAQTSLTRQAHGAFFRLSPTEGLVVSGEGDFLSYAYPDHHAYGAAGWLEVDVEARRGLHFIGTLETQNRDVDRRGVSYGAWASVAWFFYPHLDVRLDGIFQSVSVPGARVGGQSILAQLHGYL